jgi:sigma-E factor negative regulatory protein RseA
MFMKADISSLFDGELQAHEAFATLSELRHDETLHRAWSGYCVIGAALRREDELSSEITPRVMAALQREPAILAPQKRQSGNWQRPVMALAASIAGVAVVGSVAFAPSGPLRPQEQVAAMESGNLARLGPIQVVPTAAAMVKPASRRDMQEYLIAHQAYASSFRFQGGTQNIRAVSAFGTSDRR